MIDREEVNVDHPAARHCRLIEFNVGLLRQALALLEQISDAMYAQPSPALPRHRLGPQMRHVIEFYECFLNGIESSHIDYDARRRDPELERDRRAAIARIGLLIQRLELTPDLRVDAIVWVRMEDTPPELARNAFMTSSIGRELQVLGSHTTHHFALIAVIAASHGARVSPVFGMAPSTLRHMAAKAAAREAA